MTQNNPHVFTGLAPRESTAPPRCLLATSRLSSGVKAADVSQTFKLARVRHHRWAIDGMMLFDGERFAYFLSGAADAVGEAFDALAQDSQQAGTVVLYDGACTPCGFPSGWRSGWSEPDALLVLESPALTGDAAILGVWRTLIGAGDLL